MSTETKHQHREAFCLMWYACEKCGARERVWNSRDGVTPFSMPCPSCDARGLGSMKHVDWGRDEYAPNHTPPVGQRVWVSLTREAAEAYTARRLSSIQEQRGRAFTDDELDEYQRNIFGSIWHDGYAPDLVITGYSRSEE